MKRIGLFCTVLMLVIFIPGGVRAGLTLQSPVPELCYSCHSELKSELNQDSVHQPFQEGRCTVCHSVHASKHRALTTNEINELCYSCHSQLRTRVFNTKMHGAIRDGKCTDCHNPHASQNRTLLVTAEKDLCFNCHKKLKEQMDTVTLHPPFTEGKCSACHNAHAAEEDNLLKENSTVVCKNCHEPGCRVGNVSISSITSSMECVSCHTGHNANTAGLLGPYGHSAFLERNCSGCHKPFKDGSEIQVLRQGKDLCLGCHRRLPTRYNETDIHNTFQDNPCIMCHEYHASNTSELTVNETPVCLQCHDDIDIRIERMTKKLRGIRCTPVKNRQCFSCHVPVHSRPPLYFRVDADNIQTCVRCHKGQHRASHPLGEGVIDPRNGQPITCRTCHSMHDAEAEFMLQFDRERELCIQCHKM